MIKFTYIKTIFDNEILPANRFEMPWDKFCKILSKPQIVNNKEDVGLISPVEYYSEDEALDFTDSGAVRRCSDNVKTFYAIPVDIDAQISIETAQERFKDYEYILYSTFSHKSPKKAYKDCFRMFFRIKEPISNVDFLCRRNALQEFIGEHDKTTLACSRSFYIYSCPENDAHAVYFHNTGISLDVLSLPVTIEIPYIQDTTHDAPSPEFKAKILEQLGKIRSQSYEDWWKLASAMYNSGYTYSEYEQLSNTIRSHRKNNCRSQWNISKKKGITFGYLINLCKIHLGEECFKNNTISKHVEVDIAMKLLLNKPPLTQFKI
jgi:hypothetical protein